MIATDNPSVATPFRKASMKPVTVLFVCLGNICRSPLAEGILRDIARQRSGLSGLEVASAGTGGWHQGDPPDRRSIAVARRHGLDISRQRARQLVPEDFQHFDMLIGMDRNNVRDLKALAPPYRRDRVHLFLEQALGTIGDVPDPYYESDAAFETVYSMLLEGCSSLADRLERTS